MDFGIALPTAADSWKVTKEAEELGFTHAWFYDTQMLSADCFVAMGAAAVNTRRIRLGTGVLVPSNRIAPVAANALATLNQLAPGRIDFGVGTGFSSSPPMVIEAIDSDGREYICRSCHGADACLCPGPGGSASAGHDFCRQPTDESGLAAGCHECASEPAPAFWLLGDRLAIFASLNCRAAAAIAPIFATRSPTAACRDARCAAFDREIAPRTPNASLRPMMASA